MPPQLQPIVRTINGGEAYWFLNTLNIVKAATESTGEAFALVHVTAPPGHATPYHVHHTEDEAFWVLTGEFTFICDGKKHVLGPGEFIFLPRNIPHGIRCTGSQPSTYALIATPGNGFVNMMIEMAEPAKELTLPPPSQPDMPRLIAACTKHQIEILGPLPE